VSGYNLAIYFDSSFESSSGRIIHFPTININYKHLKKYKIKNFHGSTLVVLPYLQNLHYDDDSKLKSKYIAKL
jgi:hypothetical protein